MESMQPDRLVPELREAESLLEQALTEACATEPPAKVDTGELIRVEEMLALAGDAARRAISIRRKARAARESMGAVPETAGVRSADQPPALTHRLFDDSRGVRWDVWPVYPEPRAAQLSALTGTFQSGWLVFESIGEKRRLSPIPSNWESLPPGELERLCERAEIAPRRARGAPRGIGDETPPRGE